MSYDHASPYVAKSDGDLFRYCCKPPSRDINGPWTGVSIPKGVRCPPHDPTGAAVWPSYLSRKAASDDGKSIYSDSAVILTVLSTVYVDLTRF